MAYKFVEASHYTKGRTAKILYVVIHDMEMAEKPTTAENCAAYFARSTTQASSHYTIDNDSIVQCVRESDTAWCAPGANSTGVHLEHAGFASQTRTDWLDPFGKAMLALSAQLTADICKRNNIPIRKGTYEDIRAGRPCIVGHWDVTKAYPDKGSHTDPGASFPWDYYIDLVKAAAGGATLTEDEVTPQDIKAVVDGVLGARVIPANMLVTGWKEGDPVNLVAIPRALDLVMRWALEGRDSAIVARQLAEAAALKGEALTPEEVDAIAAKVGERIAAGFDVVLEPKDTTP